MIATSTYRARGLLAVVLLGCAVARPAAASAAAPPLHAGSQGPRVAALQRAFGVRVDGVFGEDLRRAVVALQRANGLRADGAVGPATWGLLERIRARARARRRSALRAAGRVAAPAAAPQRPASGAAARRAVRARRRSRGSRTRALTPRGARAARIRQRARRDATRRAAVAARRDLTLRVGVRRLAPRRAGAAPLLPLVVRRVIAAADRIATMPYRYGGGHGTFQDSGYDCSGSVSYALHGGGLLDVALASGGFMSWGEPGPGRWITIYASPGHAFMVVAGRRFDTSGRGQTGSRWQPTPRGAGAGYVVRHPRGL